MMDIDFEKMGGLVPAIIQDNVTRKVLMLGFMNKEAYQKTVETGKVTFWSRTRNCLWTKGETSGNFLNGGRVPTERMLFEWAHEAEDRGAGEILFTSMDHDGVKQGFANDALRKLSDELTIPIIASGGAGAKEHFRDTFIEGHADAALAASVFHFGEIPIPELKQYLCSLNIPIRL